MINKLTTNFEKFDLTKILLVFNKYDFEKCVSLT
jgi:hypothetical protein